MSKANKQRVLTWSELLFSQGFGTRRVCAGLIQHGLVQQHGQNITDAQHTVNVFDGMEFVVQGQVWQYHSTAYIVLNKPSGIECSQKPSAWASVYSLLPEPLRMRPNKGNMRGVQTVGRLDQDTTGLLILTDDGKLLHRMASPKHQVPKVYQVTCKHAITQQQTQQLLQGVLLTGEQRPTQAAACQQTADCVLDLTITEGKYHQVKRMVAAVGNRVEQLHRKQIGSFTLPEDLALGQWRWLQIDEQALLIQKQPL